MKIAERLLEEIAPVAQGAHKTSFSTEHERIRIVLACRSKNKAEVAVTTLRKCFPNRTLLLDVEDLDLCSMQNVEKFCHRFLQRCVLMESKG